MQYAIDERLSGFQFYSQLGQDLWVTLHSNFRKHGYFVEIGAANGVELSNTYALEKFLSWTGICIEPMNRVDELRKNRSCIIDDSCVWAKSGDKVDFLPRGLYGGIVSSNIGLDEDGLVSVETVSLNDLLKKHRAPKHIDYMSIDTEGSELNILSGFDLDVYDIPLMSVEHNGRRKEIAEHLSPYGYTRVDHRDFTRMYYQVMVFRGKANLDEMHYPNSRTGGDYDDWYVKNSSAVGPRARRVAAAGEHGIDGLPTALTPL